MHFSFLRWEPAQNFNAKILSAVVLFFLFSGNRAFAQTWKEVDDFHWTLAFTYHPMEDENNFEPVRSRSGELYQKAVAIQQASLPSCVSDIESTNQLIDSLVAKAKELDEIIKTDGSEESIRKSLREIHDMFHAIEGKCR